MPRSARNIDISDGHVVRRIVALRLERGLTKSELADAAGVTYRTVHDLESGRRARVQEKTLFLLTEALGVTPATVLGQMEPDPATPVADTPSRSWRARTILTVVFVVLVVAGIVGTSWVKTVLVPVYEPYGTVLRAEVPRLDVAAWTRDFGLDLWFCEPSPWTDDLWLVGFVEDPERGGRLSAIDRASGRTVWSVSPDLDRLRAAFPDSVLRGGHFGIVGGVPADVDGDGVPEYAFVFNNRMYYPSVVMVVDHDGRTKGHYEHAGILTGVTAGDVDDDGRDELFVTGTVNGRVRVGALALLLDHEGLVGTAPYEVEDRPEIPSDPAVVRVVMPAWEPALLFHLGGSRLWSIAPDISRDSDGVTTLTLQIGALPWRSGTEVVLHLDSALNVEQLVAVDDLVARVAATVPDSLRDRSPVDRPWLEQWTREFVRYERGRRTFPR